MRKKMITILLLGAGAILLIMISILLTNQYLPAASQTSAPFEASSPPAALPTVHSNTLENQVLSYLNYWNEKNAQQMDSLWIKEARGVNDEVYELEWIERVQPLSAREQPASSIPQELASAYSSMHAVAYVFADFTVYYNEAGQAEGMQEESKRSDFPFFLVQQSAGDEWLIAVLGY